MLKHLKRKLSAPRTTFFQREVFGRRVFGRGERLTQTATPDIDIDIELEDCDEDIDGWLVVPELVSADGWVLVAEHEDAYKPGPGPGQQVLTLTPIEEHANQSSMMASHSTSDEIVRYRTLKAIAIALANDRTFRTCFDFTEQALIPITQRIMQ